MRGEHWGTLVEGGSRASARTGSTHISSFRSGVAIRRKQLVGGGKGRNESGKIVSMRGCCKGAQLSANPCNLTHLSLCPCALRLSEAGGMEMPSSTTLAMPRLPRPLPCLPAYSLALPRWLRCWLHRE